MDWQTWSPFQSTETRQICAHLTPRERQELTDRSARYGKWCAYSFALPLAIMTMAWVWLGHSPPTWAYYAAAVPILIHLAAIPFWRRSQRRFLHTTQWAAAQTSAAPISA
jgi:cytochrome bd-type quinol oxidase subunit 2